MKPTGNGIQIMENFHLNLFRMLLEQKERYDSGTALYETNCPSYPLSLF